MFSFVDYNSLGAIAHYIHFGREEQQIDAQNIERVYTIISKFNVLCEFQEFKTFCQLVEA